MLNDGAVNMNYSRNYEYAGTSNGNYIGIFLANISHHSLHKLLHLYLSVYVCARIRQLLACLCLQHSAYADEDHEASCMLAPVQYAIALLLRCVLHGCVDWTLLST
jgi:hypothetical protein